MKILHTSDWHLGRTLYGRKRYEEFEAFLDWLIGVIKEEEIEVLLVAGDVFDTSTPSNRSQELYYRFLCQVAASCCRHVVVIAGNHDSPSFLNAPKELLRALDVHVVGSMTENLDDEVIVLYHDAKPEAIICAVPYLRDKDIRTAEPGETMDEKNIKLVRGLKNHYEEVCHIAEEKRQALGVDVPLIAMGHLFSAGGKTTEGDGVRELYVGSLVYIGVDAFPSYIDYVALGHLHVPQVVGKAQHIRYSGSPIPMGYGEANQEKKVVRVHFDQKKLGIQEITVPCFQPLVRVTGTLVEIKGKIEELKEKGSNAWLEIEYTGQEMVGNLREIMEEALQASSMEIRRIKNKRIMDRLINKIHEEETLEDLDLDDVFQRCLQASDVTEADWKDLTAAYQEITLSLFDEDTHAQ